METLTIDDFSKWMEAYGSASKENDARASSELFTPGARYYETPFAQPMVGRAEIYEYWAKGARTLKDKEATYEILSVQGRRGLARWQAQFTDAAAEKRFALDCIFLVDFDESGKCCEFREWWHIQAVTAGGSLDREQR